MPPQGGSHTNPQWHSTDWCLSWWLEQSSPALGKSLPAVIPLPQKGTQAGEAKAAADRLFQGRNQPTTRCQVRGDQQCTPTWTWTPILRGGDQLGGPVAHKVSHPSTPDKHPKHSQSFWLLFAGLRVTLHLRSQTSVNQARKELLGLPCDPAVVPHPLPVFLLGVNQHNLGNSGQEKQHTEVQYPSPSDQRLSWEAFEWLR